MAGLLEKAQPSAQEQPAEQPETAPEGQSQQAVADSQEAYDLAAGQMLNFIYDEQGTQALTKMIQSTGDPSQGMARLFGRLLMMTVQSAVMAGKRVPPQLVFQAGIEAVRALSEVAQSKGLIDPTSEKEITESAFYDGIALFATEAKDEALTEDERAQYVALLEAAEQMEQQAQGGLPDSQTPEPSQTQEMPT